MSKTVGARELRTHLGRYLARVRAGRSLVITDRGRPVAVLQPFPKDPFERLAAIGAVTLPTKPGPMAPFKPIKLRGGPSISAAISEDREDRF